MALKLIELQKIILKNFTCCCYCSKICLYSYWCSTSFLATHLYIEFGRNRLLFFYLKFAYPFLYLSSSFDCNLLFYISISFPYPPLFSSFSAQPPPKLRSHFSPHNIIVAIFFVYVSVLLFYKWVFRILLLYQVSQHPTSQIQHAWPQERKQCQ